MEEGSRGRGYYVSLAPLILRWAPPVSNTYHSSFVTSLVRSITQDETRRLVKLQTAGYTFPQTNSGYFGLKPELTVSPNPTWKEGKKEKNKKEKDRQKRNQRITYKPRSKKLRRGSRKFDYEKLICFQGNQIR